MKRRVFLGAGPAAVFAGGAVAAPLRVFSDAAAHSPFSLLRLEAGRYRPLDACRGDVACGSARLRIEVLPLRIAPGAAALAQLRVSALFDAIGAPQSSFHLLDFRADDTLSPPRGAVFEAPRETLRGLRVRYRRPGDAACREIHCSLVRDLGVLEPGDYLLVGPDRAGQPVASERLAPGADGLPNDASRDFDYLALRLREPVASRA